MKKHSVKILCCYYGKLPEWIDYWLLSCSYNPTFDFLFVSDSVYSGSAPDNVTFLNMSLDELKERFSSVLGFKAAIDNPYKLCDYRPIYGLAFQDYLTDYDFWGHCDLDIIFGNLSAFITDSLLDKYDRIGQLGHLMLYRNNSFMNHMFTNKGGAFSYNKVFHDPDHYGFDEITGMNMILLNQSVPSYKLPIVDAQRYLTRVSCFPNTPDEEFYCWRDGEILRVYNHNGIKTDAYAYLHFQRKHPRISDEPMDPNNGFYIESDYFSARKAKDFTVSEIAQRFNRIPHNDALDFKTGNRNRIKDIVFKKNFNQKRIFIGKAIALIKNRMPLQ